MYSLIINKMKKNFFFLIHKNIFEINNSINLYKFLRYKLTNIQMKY